jgi:splicing factor 3B subunit 2
MAIESYESEGMETPSGLESVTGIETPDHINLRKEGKREATSAPRSLYTVLPSREKASKGFMGSSHGYDISSSVDISLDPEELGDEDLLRKKMEQVAGVAAGGSQKKNAMVGQRHEDLSDMVNEHVGGKKRKAEDKGGKGKSGKSFKF